MGISRLERSSNALLVDETQLQQFCNARGIPYSTDFYDKVLPTEALRRQFMQGYALNPLPPIPLHEQGTSTVIVFEDKIFRGKDGKIVLRPKNVSSADWQPNKDPSISESFHGEVVSTVCEQVGNSLSPGVNALYIKSDLNPNYRLSFDKNMLDPIKDLIENQGIPVIVTSMGWHDLLLSFDNGLDEQANHFWRVTAFVVDSAGNQGRFGDDGSTKAPYQKHNIITHAAPLVVHVGAAATDMNGIWKIQGYSSANSPTFLAPVTPQADVLWGQNKKPESIIGTSVAGPYAGGVLAALNHRYGSYLTREQILYAVIATSEPLTRVKAFDPQTPLSKDIIYKKTASGLHYNAEYGGFGLINPVNADHILSHMVALTQQSPKTITIPTEERVRLDITSGVRYERDADGRYRYEITMPPGYALKTTIEVEFDKEWGEVNLTSPSGTSFPMIMSRQPKNGTSFGISTSHGWTGEKLEGVWHVTSTEPIKRLRLNQHHFLQDDIIHSLKLNELLEKPVPDLSHAIPLKDFSPDYSISRILHSKEIRGLTVAGEAPVLDDVFETIKQLQSLPSGFERRFREQSYRNYYIDGASPAGTLELNANQASRIPITTSDVPRLNTAALYEEAAKLYGQTDKRLEYVNNLSMAAQQYLSCTYPQDDNGYLNPEKSIPLLQQAVAVSAAEEHWYHAYRDTNFLYTALCHTCAYYENTQPEKLAQYSFLLASVREQARGFSFQRQGGVAPDAHRIEEGEVGFSSHERIGTDNVSQCVAIIAQDPITLKTGVAHLDNQIDVTSLDHFFEQIGENRLKIRLVGARFHSDERSRQNIKAVMDYLKHVDADLISADIYASNCGPSALVVNPLTFQLEEKVPTYPSGNEAASNAILSFTPHGKPLITQFDYTLAKDRAPIHMSRQALEEFREHYVGKTEWALESYFENHGFQDRAICVHAALGLQEAYNKEWGILSRHLKSAMSKNNIIPDEVGMAERALLRQSFYVGENASVLNSPIYDWIDNSLFKDGALNRKALNGIIMTHNCYETNHHVSVMHHYSTEPHEADSPHCALPESKLSL